MVKLKNNKNTEIISEEEIPENIEEIMLKYCNLINEENLIVFNLPSGSNI